jgi:hypothetical protein
MESMIFEDVAVNFTLEELAFLKDPEASEHRNSSEI